MFLIVSRLFTPKGYSGITVFPFIILRRKEDALDNILINHEKIHIRQQIELLLAPFFVWYVLEFLLRLVQYRNFASAYRNISFEREAYANDKDLRYLKKRVIWRFLKYL